MHNRKWTNLSVVLVVLFSLFSPFASLKTYAAAGIQLLDITEKKESTVLVWEAVGNPEEEITNYQLIKNGEVLDIEPLPLNESVEQNVKRYSYEDQQVEKNTNYTYEIAATLSTGEKVVSTPMEHTFFGQAETISVTPVTTPDEIAVTTNIKVVTDQGNIPWAFEFSIVGAGEEEAHYFGYLDEEGYFVDYESQSRDIELPIGTYNLVTYNYSTDVEITAPFTIEEGIDYVTTPLELVLPDDQLVIKKFLRVEGKTEQSISILWDEPNDFEEIEKYLVYLDDTLVKEITDPYTTSYTYSGLQPETSYQVKVDYVYKDGTIETVSSEVTTSAHPSGEVVVFGDENLKNAVKNQLKINHRDIYTDDMENLTSLDASFSEISDLTGLESAVNLVDLMLYGNQIKDLSPLANLTNLVFLDLDENLITSLADLSKLKNLEILFLAFNQIEDIQALTELPNLTHVSLYGNEGLDFSKGSDDFEVLKTLVAAGVTVEWVLESFEIFIQNVTETSIGIEFSFPAISDFISTYNLYLNGEPVAELPAGETTYEFTDLEPLTEYEISVDAVDQDGFIWGSAFNYVKTPSVPAGEIAQFKDDALKEAVRDALHIYSRELYESDMTSLISLDAASRGITELDGLELAVNLEDLLLDSNSIQNLEPLTGLTNLISLSVNYNKVTDISSLAALTNLEMLMLDGNAITDISNLSQLSKLGMLSLQGNKVNDITALEGLNIEFLNISYNEISDISSLLELEKLLFVLIMKNPFDLTEGSPALSVIQTLEDKGAMVIYDYLDITVNKVTEDSVEISWLPVTKNGNVDYSYFVMVNGEVAAAEINESSYTLTDLQPETEYRIEIMGLSTDFEQFIYGSTVVTTAAADNDNPPAPGETDGPGETDDPDKGPVGENPDPSDEEDPVPADQEPAPADDSSSPEVKQTPAKRLPNTATNSFNLLLIGLGFVVVGMIARRKVVNR